MSEALPDPLVVRVLDQTGRPVEGVSVTWVAEGGGSVSPETVPTDGAGLAAAVRVLGETAGEQTTTAEVSGLQGSPVTFTSTATDEDGGPGPL
ncbi:MAG TPA: Ig-like domain-containing protein [Gemmatimonadales bacterium]|nr:Ig-like domain-containing protein [Gemmatimonadales bacterium]